MTEYRVVYTTTGTDPVGLGSNSEPWVAHESGDSAAARNVYEEVVNEVGLAIVDSVRLQTREVTEWKTIEQSQRQ